MKHFKGNLAQKAETGPWRSATGNRPLSSAIRVANRQRKVRVDPAALEEFAKRALCRCLRLHRDRPTELTKLNEVFVWLVSDRRMAQLHQQFMGQSGPTAVLTFQHGEIFVSVETARRHAREFGNSLRRELCLYIIHGLLHLHGFDDKRRRSAQKMAQAQEEILRCSL